MVRGASRPRGESSSAPFRIWCAMPSMCGFGWWS